ncbi:MAG: flagellar protein FlaG [Acidobacteriia bacterium]|nr:flagellar protein FlaG [Terriglobia bacterium]
MDINAVNRNPQALPAVASVIPAETAAENRPVIQAVKALNGTEMFGPENELVFQKDAQSQRMVVRVVNRKTKDVVSQVPAEYLLRLAEDLKRS